MHDHATDGGIADFHDKASARDIRLHLDNSHGVMTSGWTHDELVKHHDAIHGDAAYLAEIEAAANLIAEGLAAAPPAAVDSIVGDRSLYLSDGDGTLYLAEEVDPRHMPAAGPLFRLTAQVPPAERVVDLLEATKASLAASRAYLDAHKESDGAHQYGSSTGVSAHLAGPAPAGAPTSGGVS